MEDFTLIDLIAGFVLLVSAILAYSRGFVREMLAILGWVVAAVAGFYFAQDVHPLLAEVPVLGDILGDSCELAIIAGFAVVFTMIQQRVSTLPDGLDMFAITSRRKA